MSTRAAPGWPESGATRWCALSGSLVVAGCAFCFGFAEASDKSTERADWRSYLMLARVGLVVTGRGFAWKIIC